jgi:hypothetical protein
LLVFLSAAVLLGTDARLQCQESPEEIDLFSIMRKARKDELNGIIQDTIKMGSNIWPLVELYMTAQEVNFTGRSMSADSKRLVKVGSNHVRVNDPRGKWAGAFYMGKDKGRKQAGYDQDIAYLYLKTKTGTVRVVFDASGGELQISPEFTSGGQGMIHSYLVSDEGLIKQADYRTEGYQTKIAGTKTMLKSSGETCTLSETRVSGHTIGSSIHCDENRD